MSGWNKFKRNPCFGLVQKCQSVCCAYFYTCSAGSFLACVLKSTFSSCARENSFLVVSIWLSLLGSSYSLNQKMILTAFKATSFKYQFHKERLFQVLIMSGTPLVGIFIYVATSLTLIFCSLHSGFPSVCLCYTFQTLFLVCLLRKSKCADLDYRNHLKDLIIVISHLHGVLNISVFIRGGTLFSAHTCFCPDFTAYQEGLIQLLNIVLNLACAFGVRYLVIDLLKRNVG